MMNDWKGPVIQIIGILLGSSVVLGFINNFLSTMNQPEIKILNDNEIKYNYSNDYTTVNVNAKYQIKILNVGKSPATNINLILKYPESVTNLTIGSIFSTENFTKQNLKLQDKNTLIGSLKKLSRGGEIHIDTIVQTFDHPNTDFSKDLTNCVLTISYDQNTNVSNCISETGFSFLNIPLVLIIQLSIFIVFFVIFLYIILSTTISKFRINSKNKDYVLKVKNDIFNIFNTFRNDPHSRRILSYELWNSLSHKEKEQIFNDFDVYKNIDRLYSHINNRHQAFLSSDIDDETLKVYNDNCYDLSSKILETGWRNFSKVQRHPISIPLIIIIVLSSISISLIDTFVVWIAVNTQYIFGSYGTTIFILFWVRVLITNIIITLLIKYLEKPIINEVKSINHCRTRKNKYIKYFSLSAGIMGYPISSFFSGSYYSDFTSDISWSYASIIGIFVDFGRIIILIQLVTKINFDIKPIIKIGSSTCFLSAFFCILFLIFEIIDPSYANVESYVKEIILYLSFLVTSILEILLGIFIQLGKLKSLKIGLKVNLIILIWFLTMYIAYIVDLGILSDALPHISLDFVLIIIIIQMIYIGFVICVDHKK
jgi:hypothetical protein